MGFSNPETDCMDCPCMYFHCLILDPLRAVVCLPCFCCPRAIEAEEKASMLGGDINYDIPPPAKNTPMVMPQGDASKPRDQWPQDWHDPVTRGTAQPATASTPSGTAVEDGVECKHHEAKTKFVRAVMKTMGVD